MKITLPTGCGNAPRIEIVGDIVAAWARGDGDTVAEWLADDATWRVAGTGMQTGAGTRDGAGLVDRALPGITPESLEFTSIITHGRHASCDGVIESGQARIEFSHVFRFAGASKSARVSEVRSYLID